MKMTKLAVLTALLASTVLAQTSHHQQNTPEWHFAVSGDSRNCGDVVVPSIAAGATRKGGLLLAPGRLYAPSTELMRITRTARNIAAKPFRRTNT